MDVSDEVRVDVAICTYRRSELEQTLYSIAALDKPANTAISIIVADNDETPSAMPRVEELRPAVPYEITYVHCPASNISLARNACLDTATGDFLAFIDDDETASKSWLVELLSVAGATGADAVLGPVHAVYANTAPAWMREGKVHSTFPVRVRGEIRTGYTCNVLLRRSSPHVAGRRFNLASGRTGGEDTEFFSRLHQAGGRIAYAPEARVYEPVPEARARFAWLLKRRFRFGQTHGRLLGEGTAGGARTKTIGLAAVKVAYCAVAALVSAFSPQRRNRHILRGVMHAGVVGALLGVREIRQYGELETTAE